MKRDPFEKENPNIFLMKGAIVQQELFCIATLNLSENLRKVIVVFVYEVQYAS